MPGITSTITPCSPPHGEMCCIKSIYLMRRRRRNVTNRWSAILKSLKNEVFGRWHASLWIRFAGFSITFPSLPLFFASRFYFVLVTAKICSLPFTSFHARSKDTLTNIVIYFLFYFFKSCSNEESNDILSFCLKKILSVNSLTNICPYFQEKISASSLMKFYLDRTSGSWTFSVIDLVKKRFENNDK